MKKEYLIIAVHHSYMPQVTFYVKSDTEKPHPDDLAAAIQAGFPIDLDMSQVVYSAFDISKMPKVKSNARSHKAPGTIN